MKSGPTRRDGRRLNDILVMPLDKERENTFPKPLVWISWCVRVSSSDLSHVELQLWGVELWK